MKKIAIVGENLQSPSGFGNQMNFLVRGLAKYDYDISVVVWGNYPEHTNLPTNVKEWTVKNLQDVDEIDRVLYLIQPDVVIFYWDLYGTSAFSKIKNAPRNCSIYFWTVWEASNIPDKAKYMFLNMPKDSVIFACEHSVDLWKDVTNSTKVIPCGIDLDKFRYNESWLSARKKKELRRKWGEKLRFPLYEDSLVILSVDRNTRRKRWDATFDYIRKLQDKVNRRVCLVAHCRKIESLNNSSDIAHGYNLESLADTYGVKDQVLFTGFEWIKGFSADDLIELYRLCDFRINMSGGEGFSVPSAECGALGVPQIVNSNSAVPEVLGKDSQFLIESSFFEESSGLLWGVPNVGGMIEKTLWFLDRPSRIEKEIRKVRRHVEEKFDRDIVIRKFVDVIEEEDPARNWHDYHWGYTAKAIYKVYFSNLANAIVDILGVSTSVLEIGSFDGLFIEFALEKRLKVIGIEIDEEVVFKSSEKVISVISIQEYADEWPSADAVVLSNRLEVIAKYSGFDIIDIIVNKITNYRWAFLMLEPTYVWGTPVLDFESIRKKLEEGGMTRYHHLEVLAQKKYKVFKHEVWGKDADTSKIPPALMKNME